MNVEGRGKARLGSYRRWDIGVIIRGTYVEYGDHSGDFYSRWVTAAKIRGQK